VTTRSLGDTSVSVDMDLFTGGRVGMFIYLAYGIETFAQIEGFRWGVSVVPGGKHGRYCRYTSSGFTAWSGTRHPEESWQLVKFLTSPKAMESLCKAQSFVPARKSVARGSFLRRDVPWDQGVFLKALDQARPLPNVEVVRDLQSYFQVEMDRALLGEIGVPEAAERIAQKVNRSLQEVRDVQQGATGAPWRSWPFALLVVAGIAALFVSLRSQRLAATARGWRTNAGYWFILPNFLGFLVFTVFPIAGSLALAFFAWDVLTPPRFVGLDNFARMSDDDFFWQCVFNTVFLLLALPANVFLSLLLAVVMNQKLRGIILFRTVFFLPTITAGVALFMLWRWLFNPDFGLINLVLSWLGLTGPDWLGSTIWAKPALMLMSLWIGLGGFNTILYLAALQGISPELYEAAQIDGAGSWARFRHITWPMVSPTTFFIVITGIIAGLEGGFDAAFIMTRGGPAGSTTTISYYIYNNAFELFRMGYAAAIAWFLFAVVFLLTLVGWRYGGRLVHY
jgi:multiple sugar transport system permease protein